MPDLTPLEKRLDVMRQMLGCSSYIEMEQLIGILSEHFRYLHPTGTPRIILNAILDRAEKWRKLKELID